MSLKPNARTEVRRNQYKVTVDADEGRRRREDTMVEIRKNKREESLMKKRREAFDDFWDLDDIKFEISPDIISGVWSDDPFLQLTSTIRFRKLLSIERDPPIDEVIDSGVVPRFVELLNKQDNPKIQFEAAYALTNIASGTSDHTKIVIDHNAVPIFVQLLASPDDDVREQAVWALGNVAGDSKQCRDYVLKCGALVPLLDQINENHSKLSLLRVVTWTFSNLCRGGQMTPVMLGAFVRLIYSSDEEVLTNTCWAFSFLSDGSDENIQSVIESGVIIPRLVQLLLHPCQYLVIPVLRSIGQIVTGDDLQTQCVINSGVLPCLASLISQNYKKTIKKEACWMISNITAGNKEQIQMVIEANLISPLVNLLQNGEFDVEKEAAWAITNAISNGSHDQIKYLVEQGCIKPLCDLLLCPDPGIIMVCLKGLENILKVGEAEKEFGNTEGINYYAEMIEDAQGLGKMESLESHDNYEIYEMAVKIMDTYWFEEDETTQQTLGVDGSQTGFNFN